MAEHRLGTGESLSPDLIAQRAFTTNRKGFDPAEVKAFLASVADTVRDLREQLRLSEAARRSAEERALHPKIDEEMLLSAVGEETTTILRTARTAASDIRAKAEEQAAALLRDAQSRAEAITAEAESSAARVGAEAEESAATLRAKVDEEGERIRGTARHEAEAVRQLADQERKMTVEAAQQIREQILSDLTRRRRVANTQIEQLRAGRERLLDAYVVVRRTLDEVTDELQRADGEARQAAEEVAKRAAARPSDDLLLDLTPSSANPPVVAAEGPSPEAGAGIDEETAPIAGAVLPPPTAESDDEPTAVFQAIDLDDEDAAASDEADEADGSDEDDDSDDDGAEGGGAEPLALAETRPVSSPMKGAHVVEAIDEVESVRVVPSSAGPPGGVSAPVRTERTKTARRKGPSATAPGEDRPTEPVDTIFARIRADRADAVVKARSVLDDTPDEPPAEQAVPAEDLVAAEEVTVAQAQVDAAGGADQAEAARPQVLDEDEAISDVDEEYLQRRDEATADIEVALARRLKRALQDEQNDLLDRLRQVRGTPKAVNLLPKPADHRSRYTTASRPQLDESAAAGLSYAAAFGTPEVATTAAPSVDDLAVGLAAAVSDPLRRRLQQAFAESAGEEQQVLIDALGAVYREWKTQRIEQLAGDHVTGAFARGVFAAVPDGTRLRWLAEDVGGPCPDCDDNVLAGGLIKGEEYPTGQTYPPAHPGCRCVLVPFDE